VTSTSPLQAGASSVTEARSATDASDGRGSSIRASIAEESGLLVVSRRVVAEGDRPREALARFLPEEPLRWVDPLVPRYEVREHRHDRHVRDHPGAEELDRHDRERERGVGGRGEERREAHARSEPDRDPERAAERVAERGADEEERRHLAAEEP